MLSLYQVYVKPTFHYYFYKELVPPEQITGNKTEAFHFIKGYPSKTNSREK